MGFLDRHPALRKAVANQYQAILLTGAAAFSALTLSPLPLLILAGAELMVMPFIVDRLKRRIAIEQKVASRAAVALTQEQLYDALPGQSRARYTRMRQLCDRVQQNYKGLSPASQGLVADQAAKFQVILASCLKRLWLLHKYDEMAAQADPAEVAVEITDLEKQIEDGRLAPRVREALEQKLEIQRQLQETLERNASNREALAAELDSLEALLNLLLQKSVAATDATAFSAEVDDVLQQIEADAASVREMEALVATLGPVAEPELPRLTPPLPEIVQRMRRGEPRPPAPPPRGRDREGR